MTGSTLPLFPTDDGWPYPDVTREIDLIDDHEIDLDALELRADPHAFDTLSPQELAAVVRRFGLDGLPPCSVKLLGPELGCTRSEAREFLGSGIDKLRDRLTAS